MLGRRDVRGCVHMSGNSDMWRPDVWRRTDLRRTTDMRSDDDMQLRPDMLEHLNLCGVDHMSGNRDVCASGDMRRHPHLRRIHDLPADSRVRTDIVQLPVPRRSSMRQRH